MKLAFVNSLYAPNGVGGAERTVQTLAEALVARGHEACAISLAPDGCFRQDVLNGVRTYYLPLANVHWPFGGTRPKGWRCVLRHLIEAYNPVMGARVGRVLDQEQPDVVQTSNLQGFSAAVWRAARRRRIPLVQMLHDYYLSCANSAMFREGVNCKQQCSSCRVLRTPQRLMSNTPEAVISLSQRMLDRMHACDLFPGVAQQAVIHGASNLQLAPEAMQPRPLRQPGRLTVGYLGRIEPTKGIEFMLEAAAQAQPVRVLLAGRGAPDYVQGLKDHYASAEVEFIGFAEPAALFAQVDLLVVPSLWEEPLGRVIYEAYAHGVPSIVTRMGGMPEIVEEGRTGFVVEAGDVTGLAALLRRLATNWPGDRLRQACAHKSQEFRADLLIDRYLEVWQAAAQKQSPRRSSRHAAPA